MNPLILQHFNENFVPVASYHWMIFNLFIIVLLAIDLYHFHKHPEPKSLKESMLTTLGWITMALCFNVWIYLKFGTEPALNFLAGYLLEESLSVDNLFIFLLVFSHFKVPETCKHKVLFYGVLGAIIMRGLVIWLGIVFIQQFAWSFYLLGAFLIYTGIHLLRKKDMSFDVESSWIYKLFNRFIEMTPHFHGQKFIVKPGQKWLATPLLLVLVLIETADLVFALDSVPAVLGITTDPFIVYTSNIFAILGLRSLFFVLEKGMKGFYYINDAVAALLVFIGFKMLFKGTYHIPTAATLGIIVAVLGGAIILSKIKPKT